MTEQLLAWLSGFPGWDGQLHSQGIQVTQCRRDILGQCCQNCRATFLLCRQGYGRAEDEEWLLRLQQWVLDQEKQGLAPKFGTQPGAEHIAAGKGKGKDLSGGAVRYTAELTVEYVC